jgi:glycosyltransferase involved in cell wall biosynthesis
MPKILHLIPTLEGGGAERQLAMLAGEQSRRGWSVHVALRRGGVHEQQVGDREVTIHQLGDLKGVHPLLIARTRALVHSIKPDILQTWLPQMNIVGGFVTRWISVPWVLSERSSGIAYQGMPALAWVSGRLARKAKAVIANSVEGAEYWKRTLPANHDVATINNAVDIAAIRNAAPMPCQISSDSGQIFLCVGRFEVSKAVDIFVQAVKRVHCQHDIRALLIGDGPVVQEIQASVRALALEKRVRIMPYQANWWGLLKIAAALVSPSRFEGQPNVVLEAMAAGCPLIVSDIPAHRAILDEKSALITPKDNPASLAGAIKLLLSDPEAARQRAKCASERIAGLTIQAAADAYERVYARVLTGRPGF